MATEIKYNGSVIASPEAGQTATLKCRGMVMADDVVVKMVEPTVFITDDTVAYTKSVPPNALPYASIDKLGGMTMRCANLIKGIPASYSAAGITYTLNSDGSITASGTASNISYFHLCDVEYLANEKYFMSGCPYGGSRETYMLFDDTNKFYDYGDGCPISIAETTTGKIYIRVAKGASVDNLTFKPMINKGSTALPFTPYFEGFGFAKVTKVESVGANLHYAYAIPEAVQILDGYGLGINTSLYNYIDFENRQFVKRVGKVVFDGTESWTKLGDGSIYISHSTLGISPNRGVGLCSHFEYATSGNNCFHIEDEGLAIYKNDCATADDFKAYLVARYKNGTPVTVLYEEATPTIIDISTILPDINFIEVEGGGTVTMVNGRQFAVPSEITYQIKGVMS